MRSHVVPDEGMTGSRAVEKAPRVSEAGGLRKFRDPEAECLIWKPYCRIAFPAPEIIEQVWKLVGLECCAVVEDPALAPNDGGPSNDNRH